MDPDIRRAAKISEARGWSAASDFDEESSLPAYDRVMSRTVKEVVSRVLELARKETDAERALKSVSADLAKAREELSALLDSIPAAGDIEKAIGA